MQRPGVVSFERFSCNTSASIIDLRKHPHTASSQPSQPSIVPKKKRTIEDDEDEVVRSRPSSTALSAANRPLKPSTTSATAAVNSPGWLSSRHGAFLAPSQRHQGQEPSRVDRRIPKKSKPLVVSDFADENVCEGEAWGAAVRNNASRSVLDNDDLAEADSPLSGRRFFKGALSKAADSRRSRLQKRSEVQRSEVNRSEVSHAQDGRSVQNQVIDLTSASLSNATDKGEDVYDVDSDASAEASAYDVSPVSKAQSILDACDTLSRDLQRALHQWEGDDANVPSKTSNSCVDLTAMRVTADVTADVITETDIAAVCPALTLKAYQLVGINWLRLLHDKRLNGVLADDMGLGKTVQTIAFLAHLKSTRIPSSSSARPHLIVVPASTLANWENELERFCPSLVVRTYHGSQDERADMRYELRAAFETGSIDVLLSTYTLFERESGADDRKFLHSQSFEYLILDEAHGIKNSASARFTQLNRIKTSHRLLISGTPVQNELKELLSLLSFLMPGLFSPSDCSVLLEAFGQGSRKNDAILPSNAMSLSKMRSVLAPFVLRRVKQRVLLQLAAKEVEVVGLTMTQYQSQVYSGILQAYADRKLRLKGEGVEGLDLSTIAHDITSGAEMSEGDVCGGSEPLQRELSASEANSLFTALRKAANHPLLLRTRFASPDVMQRIVDVTYQVGHFGEQCDRKMVAEELSSFSDFDLHQICTEYPKHLGHLELDASCLYDSCKTVWLREHLPRLVSEGHRMLIFSQWTRVLDLLEVLLEELGLAHLRLDGQTPVCERQALVDSFSCEQIPVFLLSTKAGGLGINLTSADVCIMHDLDFNPENDRQAEDRCHRIGQTRPVKVYKLVSLNSVDEEILRIGERKKQLSEALLSDASLVRKSDDTGEISQILQRAIQSRLNGNTARQS